MIEIIELLETGRVFSRDELAFYSGQCDRQVRDDIRKLRRQGIPVLAVANGGYKIAATIDEEMEILQQLKGRALDLLRTYSMMAKTIEIDGQISLHELLDALEV